MAQRPDIPALWGGHRQDRQPPGCLIRV